LVADRVVGRHVVNAVSAIAIFDDFNFFVLIGILHAEAPKKRITILSIARPGGGNLIMPDASKAVYAGWRTALFVGVCASRRFFSESMIQWINGAIAWGWALLVPYRLGGS
jgi:hypothetical protein